MMTEFAVLLPHAVQFKAIKQSTDKYRLGFIIKRIPMMGDFSWLCNLCNNQILLKLLVDYLFICSRPQRSP